MYPRTHPLLGSMATCQSLKKVEGEVFSAGRIVYEQEMDPDSVVFYVQKMDATLGSGQVLVVVADVFLLKEAKTERS
jgi:hypothetical protein